ncbi:hypothetical protein Catovirus_2_30 [Catovirus CTV1]|uniref:Uncharacterized protein n=1 Tax=Catovirus CTV1 TaxID=1977631 RepID=A0A1V0SBM5_9VIRU|nr:hypothetical protein Catovirus_2_30 [Catovirus CTV1]
MSDLKTLLEENQYLKKIIKLYDDPFKHVPQRLNEIKNVIDFHFKEDNELNNIIVRQIQDKFKNQLASFEYVKNTNSLVGGKQIIFVSRKTQKISKMMDVLDFKKDEFDKNIGILVKSKKGRVPRFVSFLKNYIFEYIGKQKQEFRELIDM